MNKIISLLAILGVFALPAVDRTYIGTDGDWNKSENWQPAGVPAAGDRALFLDDTELSVPFSLPGFTDINVKKNITLRLTGTISGTGALVFSGQGTVKLEADNTFTGDFIHSNGTCYAQSPKALGADGSGKVEIYIIDSAFSFSFVGVDTTRDISIRLSKNYGSDQITASRIYFGTSDKTTCVNYLRGAISRNKHGYLRLRAFANSTTYFMGGINSDTHLFLTRDKDSQIIVDKTPTLFRNSSAYEGGKGWLTLNCAGNTFISGSSGFSNSGYGNLRVNVDYALTSDSRVCQTAYQFDLNGTQQKVACLFGAQEVSTSELYSETPALLTLTDNRFHTNTCAVTGQASLTYEGASEAEILLAGKSTSSGTLSVDGARTLRMTENATWKGKIALKNGGILHACASGNIKDITELRLDTTATLKLDFNEDLTFEKGIIIYDGQPLAPGLYGATAGEGVTVLSALQGTGRLFIPMTPGAPSEATWTGMADDKKMSTGANWTSQPDLTGGGLTAHFNPVFQMLVDGPYLLTRLSLAVGAGYSDITATENGALTFVSGGGITIAPGRNNNGEASQNRLYMGAPIVINGTTLWQIGSAEEGYAILYVTNTVSGYGEIIKEGRGKLYLTETVNVPLLTLTGGPVYFQKQDMFSQPHNALVVVAERDPKPNQNVRLTDVVFYADQTFNGPLTIYNYNDVRAPFITAAEGVTVIHNGPVYLADNYLRYKASAVDSCVYFRGGITATKSQNFRHLIFSGKGRFIIEDTAIGTTGHAPSVYFDDLNSTVTFSVANNTFESQSGFLRIHNHLHTTVDNAFNPQTGLRFYRPTADLNIEDTQQTFTKIVVTNELSNSKPQNPGHKARVFGTTGGGITETGDEEHVALQYDGGIDYTYTGGGTRKFLQPCATTGACTLDGAGCIRFDAPAADWAGGSWTGKCARVSLGENATGSITFGHADAIGRYVDVTLERNDGTAGTIDIASGIRLEGQFLYINGERQSLGTYGGPDSGATHKLPCFTGTGVIEFLGDGKGLRLLLR